jgi:ABC-type thiamin/hydroxymethylpyrimidine transport system permease subunit
VNATLLSPASLSTAGVLLLAIVTIEWGGIYMLRVVRGREPLTDFQKAFARAGHAHAGVLVILSLVCQIFVDAAAMRGVPELLARNGIPAAAILISAGFFISSIGRGLTQPNRFIVVLYAGVAVLAIGVVSLGIGLLAA